MIADIYNNIKADKSVMDLAYRMDMGILTDKDYKNSSDQLCMFFDDEFYKWWNSDKFNWSHKFLLIHNCAMEFHKWYDSNKVWDESNRPMIDIVSKSMTNYCNAFRDIWYPDYVTKLIMR
jgi:hypothetical protein